MVTRAGREKREKRDGERYTDTDRDRGEREVKIVGKYGYTEIKVAREQSQVIRVSSKT